jgi:hypothetical protein
VSKETLSSNWMESPSPLSFFFAMNNFYPDNPSAKPKAITFAQLIEYGKTQINQTLNGASSTVLNGFPYYFRYERRTIFQTGDPTYFRVTSETANLILRSTQILVTAGAGTTIAVDNPN